MTLANVRKFLVALIPVVVTVGNLIVDALTDGVITTQEVIATVVAALVAAGVYQVRNEPVVPVEVDVPRG